MNFLCRTSQGRGCSENWAQRLYWLRNPVRSQNTTCGGVLCALITGREVGKAASLTVEDLLAVVGGLPDGKGHYADRAIRALRLALEGGLQ